MSVAVQASPNLMLPAFDPSLNPNPSSRRATRRTSGDSLLYHTYDDYFNMEEEDEIASPATATVPLKSPLHFMTSQTQVHDQPPEPEKLSVSTNTSGAFFFVLSASSPISPSSDSETGFTPISPLKPGDIPEALSSLLPQPTNSLLEVINVTQSGKFPTPATDEEGEEEERGTVRGRSLSRNEPAYHRGPETDIKMMQAPTHTTIIHPPHSRSPSRAKPTHLQLRESAAPVPISQVVIHPPSPPTSSIAEVAISPPQPPKPPPALVSQTGQVEKGVSDTRRPNPITVHDPQSRLTYPSRRPLPRAPSPSPPSTLTPGRSSRGTSQTRLLVQSTGQSQGQGVMRPRIREARSMEALGSTLPGVGSRFNSGHTRGLSSPFPLPIQFDFAPASVPGSATTPYSYF